MTKFLTKYRKDINARSSSYKTWEFMRKSYKIFSKRLVIIEIKTFKQYTQTHIVT